MNNNNPLEKKINEKHLIKRISPLCKNVENKIIKTRQYILIIFLFALIFPLLYIIPCSNTNIYIQYNRLVEIEPFMIDSYSNEVNQNHNLTVSEEISDKTWKIQSVILYLNSFQTDLNNIQMMQQVEYNQIDQNTQNNQNKINNLKFIIFNNNNYTYQFSQIGQKIHSTYECPVDYVLSYLEITIISNLENEDFIFKYYHFFQNNERNDIKFNVISELTILSFNFDMNAYIEWYNWKHYNGEIPTVYPYMIDVYIRRYNLVTEYFKVESI
jgi:hypothetical protein